MKPKRPAAHAMPVEPDLSEVAQRCSYHGSIEHKDKRSWLGLPRPRRRPRDVATICALVTPQERDMATEWVREAIRNGQFDPDEEFRNGFPRHIWHRTGDDGYWHGFLMNEGAGPNATAHYKGWPISKDEWDEIFG